MYFIFKITILITVSTIFIFIISIILVNISSTFTISNSIISIHSDAPFRYITFTKV